jgi:RHS repeat-associated protein
MAPTTDTHMKKLILLFGLILFQVSVFAQIVGETNVTVNGLYTYSYTRSTAFTSPAWSSSMAGIVEESWLTNNNRTSNVSVHFSTAGSPTLAIKNGSTTLATTTITVTCAPAVPTFKVYRGSTQTNTSCVATAFRVDAVRPAGAISIKWYASQTATTPFFTGDSYTTPTLSANTEYYIATSYALASGSTCATESSRARVWLVIDPVVQPPSYTFENYICGTSGTALITALTGSGQARWYNQPTGGTLLSSNTMFTTPTLTAPATYYVSSLASAGCESARIPVQVNLYPVPAAPTVSSATVNICGTGPVQLSATPGANGDDIYWTSSSLTHIGTPLTVASPVSGTVYYAQSMTEFCLGPTKTSITLAVSSTLPAPTDMSSSYVYGYGQVTLGSKYDAILRWYDVPTGGTILSTGMDYKTPILYAEKTYYAARFNSSGCESPRTAITARILPLIAPSSNKTEVIRVPDVRDETQLAAVTDAQKNVSLTYYDGLLRPLQQTAVKASPAGSDVVQPIEYDAFGHTAKSYLPYVLPATANGAYQTNYATAQANFYQAANDKIANDNAPYAVSRYENSPLGRVIEQGNVGADWQPGTNHTARVNYSYNTGATNNIAEEVRLFNSDGTSTGFYGANTLDRLATTDEQGNTTIVFQNDRGQVIAKKQALDETINGVNVPYLETYYVYDDFGRVLYIISPKGVAALRAASWSLSAAIKDSYCYQFVYDARGRAVEKKVPGKAWTYYVYDNLDRLVLTQDGFLKATNQWLFLKYDRYGRAVMQGLYTNPTQTTRVAVQVLADALYTSGNATYPEAAWFESRATTLHGYTNNSFPKTNASGTALDVMQVNYFDNYDFDANGADDYSYVNQGLAGEAGRVQGRSTGLSTGSKRLVLDATTWLYSYIFYDVKGRPIQVRTNNHLNPSTIDNLMTTVQDFEGKTLVTKLYHNAGTGRVATIINKYEYDVQGRLAKVYQNNNAAPTDQLLAQYTYNELGQLVDKKLHNTSGTSFLQSVDYRYTLQGALSSINNATLSSDAVNDETDDYFGLELLYQTTESGLTSTPYYNGNVNTMKWKGPGAGSGTDGQRSYRFTYDKANRLETATSAVRASGAWTAELNAINETLEYDHNGNITRLQRNQRKHQITGVVPNYIAEAIDDLTYSYNIAIGDRLDKVTDATAHAGGFNNGASGTANDYTYDVDGKLLTDANKTISGTIYNLLGKATRITFTDGRKIEYAYDAAGAKVSEKTYNAAGTLVTTTDYVGSFVYENSNLKFFGTSEGRVVKNGTALEYQYGIADHQGNTRVIFTSATPVVDGPIATFEGNAGDQSASYLNLNANNIVSFGAANHTSGGSKVVRMNQTYRIGPAKSMKVYPGDKVDIEVWEYHEATSGYGSSGTPLTNFISAVASAFGGVSGGSGESGSIFSSVNSAITTFGHGGGQGDGQPAAYLNYILFDQDSNVLDAGWQLAPASSFTKQKLSFNTLNIREVGYMYVYLSYEDESNNWVYFDDLKVTYTPSPIVQYNEYYPYGLQTSASWTRESTIGNKFLYNAGSELNATTGLYQTLYRDYDAALGRFIQIDPLALEQHDLSPYQYANNNPVAFNDPNGDMFEPNYDRWAFLAFYKDYYASYASLVGGYMGNGSRTHWSDSYRSVEMNLIFMSAEEFRNYYGLNEKSDSEIADFVKENALDQHVTGYMVSVKGADGKWSHEIHIDDPATTRYLLAGRSAGHWDTSVMNAFAAFGFDGAQQGDPAYGFHFTEDEAGAYSWMRAMMDRKDGKGRVLGVETVGVLSINQKTNKKGVLILPWAGNEYDNSNATIGFNGEFFTDDDGTRYTPLAIVHTHPNNEIGPPYWGNSRGGDLSRVKDFGNLPLYILGSSSYVQFWPSPSGPGYTSDLKSGNVSLFPK